MTDFQAWIPPAGAVVDPPVANWRKVLGMYSDGSQDDEPKPAGDLNWSAEGDGPSVVAYAVVEEYTPAPKVAREWWINPYNKLFAYAYPTQEQAEIYGRGEPITHVREVLPGREVVAWAVVNRDGVAPFPTESGAQAYRRDLGGTVVKLTGVMQ